MPHYYFDIYLGPNFLPDEDGQDCENLDVAEMEATSTAFDLGLSHMLNRDVRDIRIAVKDDDRQQMLNIVISMKSERIGLPAGQEISL
ncbi:DUF6894 family protein [Microvirga arsenatis]|uniref:DUF6894 domain-containing protein n=1 Tax=Microvirga arsenatis TaxID=2692265 RepID=A0ABW9Z842_9HYPH|nr:hypothetical protein [Microvirga arsenatis]NBJ13931.1 hypothetical protein [Microvirga arsenatis]NBJ27378.1 hypothetical protein [Microvirga arsenatis]